MSHIVKPSGVSWDFQMADAGGIEDILGPNGTQTRMARYTTDASGNIIGLAGAGGVTRVFTAGPQLALWGDSLAANYEAVSTTNYYTTSYSPFAVAARYLNQRFDLVYNGGVSGERTDEILARFSTIASYNPSVIFMTGGVNDISQGIATATILANLGAMIDAALSTGALVCVQNVHLCTSFNTEAEVAAMLAVNEYLRGRAYENNLIVGDAYSAVVDVTGTIVTNALADGTHFSPLGADMAGRMWAEQLTGFFPPRRSMISTLLDRKNLVDNGAFSGSNASGSNGFTLGTAQLGVGPNNWTLQRTGSAIISTGSKVNRSNWMAGQGWRATIGTGGANNDRLQMDQTISFRLRPQLTGLAVNKRIYVPSTGAHYQVTVQGVTENTADPSGSWSTKIGATITDGTVTLVCVEPVTAGDTVQGEFEYAISSLATGQVNPQLKVVFKDSAGSTMIQLSGNLYSGTEGELPAALATSTGVVRTGKQTIPATWDLSTCTTSAGPQINTIVELWTRNGATCVFDAYCCAVRKV